MPAPALQPVLDPELAPPDAPGRPSLWRRLVRAPFVWAKLLLFPTTTLPEVLAAGRFGGVLLVTALCAGLAVTAVALRLDMTPELLRQELRPPPAQGGAAAGPMSDREFDEAVEKARAVEIVKRGAGALLVPLRLLLLGLALFLVARFVGAKTALRPLLVLGAHAGLPGAVHALIAAAAALRRTRIAPEQVLTLVPPPWGALDGPPLQRLLAGCDPFTLWALVLVALGLPRAAGLRPVKAYVTIGVCFVLLRLVSL
ncbi:MAG TPA: hypothetical protein VGQ83_03345 [Polyangia bacterium]|jgi:hypothetical protein